MTDDLTEESLAAMVAKAKASGVRLLLTKEEIAARFGLRFLRKEDFDGKYLLPKIRRPK